MVLLYFFFSSRRRHTRYIGDWSSDVCSSDLRIDCGDTNSAQRRTRCSTKKRMRSMTSASVARAARRSRSEERRVGKECRYRGAPYHEKEKGGVLRDTTARVDDDLTFVEMLVQ